MDSVLIHLCFCAYDQKIKTKDYSRCCGFPAQVPLAKESHPVGVDHGHIYGFSREMPSRLRSAEQGRLRPFNPTLLQPLAAPTPAAGGQNQPPCCQWNHLWGATHGRGFQWDQPEVSL